MELESIAQGFEQAVEILQPYYNSNHKIHENMFRSTLNRYGGVHDYQAQRELIHILPNCSANFIAKVVAGAYRASDYKYSPVFFDYIIRNYGTQFEVPVYEVFKDLSDRYREAELTIDGVTVGALQLQHDGNLYTRYTSQPMVRVDIVATFGSDQEIQLRSKEFTFLSSSIFANNNFVATQGTSENFYDFDGGFTLVTQVYNWHDLNIWLHETIHSTNYPDHNEEIAMTKISMRNRIQQMLARNKKSREIIQFVENNTFDESILSSFTASDAMALLLIEYRTCMEVLNTLLGICDVNGLPRISINPLVERNLAALGNHAYHLVDELNQPSSEELLRRL